MSEDEQEDNGEQETLEVEDSEDNDNLETEDDGSEIEVEQLDVGGINIKDIDKDRVLAVEISREMKKTKEN